MKVTIAEQEFTLAADGCLYWPAQNMLIVADLHLEKSSHFARRGFFLPPYDSHATLQRLLARLRDIPGIRLLILGDCFHDSRGHERLAPDDRALFDALYDFRPVWISGNHDGGFVPPGMESFEVFEYGGIAFRHEAAAGEMPEISGHFHPKVTLSHKGGVITRPCFVEDGRKMIVPAFGVFTGGLEARHPAIARHFPAEMRLHALGAHKVYTVPAQTGKE